MPYNIAVPVRDMDELIVRPVKVFREKLGLEVLLGHEATRIDRQNKEVFGYDQNGKEFSCPYDKLLIATGASPIIPDLPGFDLEGVMPLNSLDQGRRIKNFLATKKVNKVVIIGMGYIALEMAEAMAARDIQVDMVKPRKRFLPWMNKELSARVWAELQDQGVNLYPGHDLQAIEQENSQFRVIAQDVELKADLIIVATGIKPNSELAEEANLELGPHRSIAVDKNLRTSDGDIFSAGDCADAYHLVTGKKTWIPLALRANRAGRAVADNVTKKNTKLDGVAGTAVFKVFDLEVAKTGIDQNEAIEAGFSPVEIVIQANSRAHVYPGAQTIFVYMLGDKDSGRLLGAQMVGKEGVAHRINAPAVAIHNKMTVQDFSQADLAYAPPFSPVWDPMLVAANQLIKNM